MRATASAFSKWLMLTKLAGVPDPNHREEGAEEVLQVLRASLALAT